MRRIRYLSLFLSTVVALGLTGCSLKKSETSPSLLLDLSSFQDRSGRFSLLNSGSLLIGLAPPQVATGFSCYAVNVTGPSIPDSSGNPEGDPMTIFNKTLSVPGNYCSYRGVISPPVYLDGGNATVGLKVPPGDVRLIQVVGVNDPYVCASGVIGQDDDKGSESNYFEIGRGVVYDLRSDRSVEIITNWPSGVGPQAEVDRASRALDCGGNNCQYPINAPAVGVTGYTGTIGVVASTGDVYVAQKFNVSSPTYLRKAEIYVDGPVGTTVTVEVYESSSNILLQASDTALGPIAYDLVDITQTGGQLLSFDFYDPSYGYEYIEPGVNYFVVISVDDDVTLMSSDTVGETGSVSAAPTLSSTFTVRSPKKQIFMKINACN